MNILTNFKPLRTMKQKRLKNYLKIGSLLFGIFIVILACQEESFDNPQETTQVKKLKRITLSELNSRIGNSNDYSKLSAMFDVNKPKATNYQKRLETSDNPYLLTDEIAVVEKENATFYTFKIESDATGNEFYNLVVAMDESNAIRSTRILEYIPSDYWLQNTSEPFNGEVKIHENDIFSVADINNMFSARGSNQCVSGVTGEWECNLGNNHAPGEGQSCTSWEYIITVHWGPCPETIDAGDSGGGGGGFPVDGGNTGGGGGGTSDGGSGNNNDNGNPPDDGEECILDSNGNCLTDDTTPLPPRDLIEDDDCDTSKEDLKKVFPNMSDTDAKLLASVINDKGTDFGIDSDEDLWHFLSQAGHETGGFNTLNVTESTYWTTASKLAATYSKFTMDSTLAATNSNKYYAPDYLQNSSGVANVAMCCKYGNGNAASGDGYKYRGRGLFQLTWKDNYSAFKTWYNNKYDPDIDPVTTPNIISTNDTLAILSGLWYYKTRVVDKITIDSTTTVKAVTKPINSARKGLSDRKERFQKAKDSINCL